VVPVDEVKKHGGSRGGAGRPPTIKGKKREIYCDDETWKYLVSLGKGNASKGVRLLKEAHIHQTNEIERGIMAQENEA
jgi:hypothetical protein